MDETVEGRDRLINEQLLLRLKHPSLRLKSVTSHFNLAKNHRVTGFTVPTLNKALVNLSRDQQEVAIQAARHHIPRIANHFKVQKIVMFLPDICFMSYLLIQELCFNISLKFL